MKKGFTLIELVVVLVILAIVTHLATREMTHIKNSRLHDAAQKQFSEIKNGVFEIGNDGKAAGFVADLGRLPQGVVTTNSLNLECITLEELWKKPSDIKLYKVRRAIAANLVVNESEKNTLEDPDVRIGCGWRGPYLRRPFNDDRLVDVWGNRMENKDDAGYDRLFASPAVAAQAGDDVRIISHYGSDGRLDSDSTPQLEMQKDETIEFLPDGGMSNTLALNLIFHDGSDTSPVTGDVVCKWYAPCGSSITGAVEKATLVDTASKTIALEGLPPGECMVTISVGGVVRLRRYVTVPPGGTTREMKVPIP